MKKGCLIAVAVVVFLAVVVSIGAFVAYKKMGGSVMDIASAGVLYGVEAGAAAYQAQNPEAQVETTNEAWAAVLKDFEVEGESLSRIVIDGKLVDSYQNPVKIELDSSGLIKALSSGKDGIFGTEDDVTSAKITELEEKFGNKAE